MLRRSYSWTIIAAFTAVLLSLIYFNQCYFFTPLMHKRYAAAHLPWTWYKNPLQLEYGVLDDDGWKFTKVTDKNEIKKVFTELSRCLTEPVNGDPPQQEESSPVWFGIRRLCDGMVLLSAEGWESNPYFHIRDLATLCLTPELQALLTARLQQARALPPIN